jgi:hypothetical protein
MSKTALVLIHLSSIDSYADHFRQEDPAFDGAWALSQRIAAAAIEHDGPVVICDQDWDYADIHSRPRFSMEEEIARSGRKVTRIHFDEDESPWEPFLKKLKKTLERLDVDKVILGGVWFDPDQKDGCVTATYEYLEQYFDTKVASDLVGVEQDLTPYGPHTWTYKRVLRELSR